MLLFNKLSTYACNYSHVNFVLPYYILCHPVSDFSHKVPWAFWNCHQQLMQQEKLVDTITLCYLFHLFPISWILWVVSKWIDAYVCSWAEGSGYPQNFFPSINSTCVSWICYCGREGVTIAPQKSGKTKSNQISSWMSLNFRTQRNRYFRSCHRWIYEKSLNFPV